MSVCMNYGQRWRFYKIVTSSGNDKLLAPVDVLETLTWSLEPHTALYLAGYQKKPDSCVFEEYQDGKLVEQTMSTWWSKVDTTKVLGEIDRSLTIPTKIMAVQSEWFDIDEETINQIRSLKYRPAYQGEFLQLLWLIQTSRIPEEGYYYCLTERAPGFALVAKFFSGEQDRVFDLSLGFYLEDWKECEGSDDTYCFFVYDESRQHDSLCM